MKSCVFSNSKPWRAQVRGDDRRGDTRSRKRAVRLDAGATIADLDRVEHALAVLEPVEAVPRLARMQHPAVRVRSLSSCLGRILERDPLAGLRVA